jgi:hypothetical protein
VYEPIYQPFVLLNHVTDFEETAYKNMAVAVLYTSGLTNYLHNKDNMADVLNRQMEDDETNFM